MNLSIKLMGAASAVAMSALAASSAMAATTFDFTGGTNANESSFNYTLDNIGLEITGQRKVGSWKDADVTRRSGGLGVTGGWDTSTALDGQVDERMTFQFDQDVSMMSIMFSGYDANDPYDIYVDSGSGYSLISADSQANPYTFTPALLGDTLRIAVDGNASAFRVSSLTVEAVPLPAGGLLLVGGLAGLGALRRRRKAA